MCPGRRRNGRAHQPAPGHRRAALRSAPRVRLLAVGTPAGMETRLVPAAGLDLATIGRVPFPAQAFAGPAAAARPAGRRGEAGRRHPGRGPGRRPGRRRRLRVHADVPGRPAPEDPDRHPRGQHPARPGQPGGRPARRHVAVAFAATRLRARPARRHADAHRKSPAWTGRPPADDARAALGLDPHRPTLIVTGGSSGAQSINRTIAASLPGPRRRRHPDPAHHRPRQGRPRRRRQAARRARLPAGRVRRRHGERLRRGGPAAGPRPVPPRSARWPPSGCRRSSFRCRIGNGEQALNAAGLVEAGGPCWSRTATSPRAGSAGELIPLLPDPARLASDGGQRRTARHPRRRPSAWRTLSRSRQAGEEHAMTSPADIRSQRTRLPSPRPVHFIGIGGVGMSAVARIMVARGVPCQRLRRQGPAGHGGAGGRRRPDRRRLRRRPTWATPRHGGGRLGHPAGQSRAGGRACRRLPVLHRSEALAAAMAEDTLVTVAGTHGKSTTTSMITVLLQGAGLDPSFAIGGDVPALGVNAATGQRRHLCRRSGRIRRLVPELPAAGRRRDQRRGRPPGLLRHRRSRLRLLRPVHGAASGRRRRWWPARTTPAPAPWRTRRGRVRGTAGARLRLRGGRRAAHRCTTPAPAAPAGSHTPAATARCGSRSRASTTSSTPPRPSPSPWNSGVDPETAAEGAGRLHRGVPAVRSQGRGGRGPRVRRLRPPSHRGPRRPDRRPDGGGRTRRACALPAAPVFAHPGVRRGVCRRRCSWPIRRRPGHLSGP